MVQFDFFGNQFNSAEETKQNIFIMPRATFNSRQLVQNIFIAAQQADSTWKRDSKAASKIQATFRMHRQRKQFLFTKTCAIALQRIYRGYKGRLRVLDHKIELAEKRRAQIFHFHARNIQRIFRGFISRKYINDFCAQKAYIARIASTSESVRQAALDARHDQERYLAYVQTKELRKDFAEAAKNKHHLLSTATCPGVFRSPLEPEGTKTVFGSDIEEEIRKIPMDQDEIKIRRSKFLKDVIPVGHSNNNNDNSNGNLNSYGGVVGAVNSSGASATTSRSASHNNKNITQQQMRSTASVHSAKVAAGVRTTISGEPYRKSLLSESEYEQSDHDVDRKIEDKIISKLHGQKAGASYFHVPKSATRSGAPALSSGFTAKMK